MATATKGGPKDVIRVIGNPTKYAISHARQQDKMDQSYRNQTYMLISLEDTLSCNPVTSSL